MVDTRQSQPLLVPIGDLVGDIAEAHAREFFDRPENQSLVAPGGPYHGCDGRPASWAILSPDLSISKSLGWWPTAIRGLKVTPLHFHLLGRSVARAASGLTVR